MCGGGCGSSDVGVVRGDDADDLAHEEHGLGGEEHLVSHPDAPQVGAGHGEGGRRVQAADPGVRLAALLLGLCFCNRKCFNLLNKLKIL